MIEDFFGFKELGIDKEHDNLNIPTQLWYAHDEEKKKAAQKSKMKQHRYPIPPKFQPVSSSQPFIGLLRPWYNKRLKEDGMIEDEYKRSSTRRPPHPPVQFRYTNSKLLIMDKPRKRVLEDGSNTIYEPMKPPVKRRKSVMDDATKAERKKQRMELKAQKKQAEKEQKKKQREEIKSAKQMAKKNAQQHESTTL